MSELTIVLKSPVKSTIRENGESAEVEITELVMREPKISDFAGVSVNEPTIGQLISVAAKCCINLPSDKFNSLVASNLMPVANWVGGFLHGSR